MGAARRNTPRPRTSAKYTRDGSFIAVTARELHAQLARAPRDLRERRRVGVGEELAQRLERRVEPRLVALARLEHVAR